MDMKLDIFHGSKMTFLLPVQHVGLGHLSSHEMKEIFKE